MTPEQKRAKKREAWKRWASKNKEYLRERDKKRRSCEEYNARRRELYALDPEHYRENCKRWRSENPDKANDPVKINAAHAKYRSRPEARERERRNERKRYAKSPEKWKESQARYLKNEDARRKRKIAIREWAERNPGARPAYTAARRARQKQAAPSWLSEDQMSDMKKIYTEAKRLDLTVDHIVPISGKDVCGLHVPWNLQLLSGVENSRKGNVYHV